MAQDYNTNPAYIDQALEAIKIMESRGQKQPYQLLHEPVELLISGTAQEQAAKAKQFNKLGFVTKKKDDGMYVIAQALGAYGILDIDINRFARDAGLAGFDFRQDKSWQDAKAQDKIARYLANKYFQQYGAWDLVRVAWFGGPGRAQKLKENGNYELKPSVKEDLDKFKNEFAIVMENVEPIDIYNEGDPNRGIPAPDPGFKPFPLPLSSTYKPSDINIPNQGPYGRAESTVASLFSKLLPESSRGVVEKMPNSAREVR